MSTVSSLNFISEEIILYLGSFLYIIGNIGGVLVLIVFLSLKAFRHSSCAFYLTVLSAVNLFYLSIGLLTSIMIYGFHTNWINQSAFFCKLRAFYDTLCGYISFTCICLAVIDQFLATCSRPRWHRWNNIKIARLMSIGTVIFWCLHGIQFLIYFDLVYSPITRGYLCMITNLNFQHYFTYFDLLILGGCIPVSIMIIFGLLAYRNVQQIAYRTVPLVRRELDKQLTLMVLIQACLDIFSLTFIFIQAIVAIILGTPTDAYSLALILFVQNLTIIIYYSHFVNSFYIYICVSKRFRQQLIYVLDKIHRRHAIPNNQIEPRT